MSLRPMRWNRETIISDMEKVMWRSMMILCRNGRAFIRC